MRYFCMIFFTCTLWSQDALKMASRNGASEIARGKKANQERVLAHVSVNDTFQSDLLIRSDSTDTQGFSLYFYGPDGLAVNVKFNTSDNEYYEASGFNFELSGYEIFAINFEEINGWPSIQVVVVTTESDRFYSIENTYKRYAGSQKVASVGALATDAYTQFLMNVDERLDPVSNQYKYRGLAVTNISNNVMSFTVYLYDRGVGGLNTEGYLASETIRNIPANGKWLGYVSDFFPNLPSLLTDDLGYILIETTEPSGAIGLSFEENSYATGSVPIEPIVIQ